MFKNTRTDLCRYVKNRVDCKSVFSYMLQFLPVIFFHEGAITMIGYRIARWFTLRGYGFVGYILSKLFFFATSNYIHHGTDIAPGCKINHSSVVIHAKRIGENFECSANITIGQKIPYQSPYPEIGRNVIIGAGARVLCDVGDEVIIGANAVVVKPIKSGCIAIGIPARELRSSQDYIKYIKNFYQ